MEPLQMVFYCETMCSADEHYNYYNSYNVTRSTLAGVYEYRSALTLDWLAAEDFRQRELAAAFETEAAPPARTLATECMESPRPSGGKVAGLILELLKNLEGDNAKLVPALTRALVRAKILVETTVLDLEPDLESLVKTPAMLLGEPHVNFPRILAMVWMVLTDPGTVYKYGWCPVNKINQYLWATKPASIAKHMRALEPIAARARFIMDEFIQSVTPLDVYQNNIKYRAKSCLSANVAFDKDMISNENRWTFRQRKQQDLDAQCTTIRPTAKDIIRRFSAILPYIDRDHSNTAFLHKLRGTIYNMSEGEDALDREAAYYAAVLTPIVFLQQFRGAWCLLERFHRALRLYQISHPTEKRSALKLLQNMIEVNRKIRTFVFELPGATSETRATSRMDDDSQSKEEKEIVYFKELIKNFE